MLPFLKISEVLEAFSPLIKEHLLAKELLTIDLSQRLNELSNGQLHFMECLWILSQPAEYILLDEPFSAIAPIQVEFLQQMIIETAREKGNHTYRPHVPFFINGKQQGSAVA